MVLGDEKSDISRRRFLQAMAAAGASLTLLGGGANGRAFAEDAAKAFGEKAVPARPSGKSRKVLVLGIDGMDPNLLRKHMDAGEMPNFARLIAQGGFRPLQTSTPPQSPVAWSNFITGMDPGGHGIFDFLHRDPATIQPFLSMSKTQGAAHRLNLGSWSLPLSSGKALQLRKGKAFWQVLGEHGIPATIYKMPANFPPVPFKGKSLSGMGTPDLTGSQGGSYTFFTSRHLENEKEITGSKVELIEVRDNRVEVKIVGPANEFRRVPASENEGQELLTGESETRLKNPKTTIDLRVFLDPEEPVAKFEIQGQEFILKEGEWSDWIHLEFKMIPGLASVRAVCRLYLQKVRPDFRLYLSPHQIDPENPALPISTPGDWSRDLAERVGLYYTQGLPIDTKALSHKIFSGFEYWELSSFMLREQLRALDYLLETFERGVLFFYICNIDQDSHMLWRYQDPQHPAYDTTTGPTDGIATRYREMDEMLGRVFEKMGDDTDLIVMSDHGFSPFYWEVNLNTWLLDKGYVVLKQRWRQEQCRNFDEVDWRHTTAYALGLNGVYVNRKGREVYGVVDSDKGYQDKLNELEKDLLEMQDTERKEHPITQVIQTRRDLHGGNTGIGPDIIVGYNRGYRVSWKSPMGEFPKEHFPANLDAWSADHCVDSRVVPGILVSNRKITMESPALYDVTAAVLALYGISPLPEMLGKNCLEV